MNSANTTAGSAAAATTTATTASTAAAAAVQLEKYGLHPLPENFVPTEEETVLLQMYEIVKNTERVAARLKEEAARNKLNARNEEFTKKLEASKSTTNNKKKNRKKITETTTTTKKKKQAKLDNDDISDNDDDDDDMDEDDDDDDIDKDDDDDDEIDDDDDDDIDIDKDATLFERREAKLESMREEIEEAKIAAQALDVIKENELREELLKTAGMTSTTSTAINENESYLDGPTIIRRKRDYDKFNIDNNENNDTTTGTTTKSSIIANMTAAVTPPHDFSKSLELDTDTGIVLFPTSVDEYTWSPPEGVYSPNDGALTLELHDFDVSQAQLGIGNNTVGIKFNVPIESKRFSINITTNTNDNDNFNNVLFHFNPRQREKGGQVVINDKQDGTWGQALNLPLSQLPLMFGQTSCTLIIQITGDGFDVFLENKHCARLEHRTELPIGSTDLIVQCPSTDDSGKPENWIVYKVWWGNRPIMAKLDTLSNIAGVNSYNSLHPRKLFISGLTKIYKAVDVDIRRAELERAFVKYGGARGAHVIVPIKSTFAFVEFESSKQADAALAEINTNGQYRLNRARRSKHEAIQDERAAKEQRTTTGTGTNTTTGTATDREWN